MDNTKDFTRPWLEPQLVNDSFDHDPLPIVVLAITPSAPVDTSSAPKVLELDVIFIDNSDVIFHDLRRREVPVLRCFYPGRSVFYSMGNGKQKANAHALSDN